jgi:hypothetical protein
MPITQDQLQKHLDEEGLRYYVDPKRDAVLLQMKGQHGSYQFVVALQSDGKFLQFRTLGLLTVVASHPHHAAIMTALARINAQHRLLKLGWDEADGEVMAFADHWMMDGSLTQAQFHQLAGNYFTAVDDATGRLNAVLASGVDPGPQAAGAGPAPSAKQPDLPEI